MGSLRARILGVGVLLAAGAMGVHPAVAVETAEHCLSPTITPVTTVNQTFAVGSQWVFDVQRRMCEGLAFTGVRYKPKGGTLTTVLASASIAELHVPYFTGTPRFLDVTHDSWGLGALAVAQVLSAGECPGGTLYDGGRVCIRLEDEGYAWKLGSAYRRAQAIEVMMVSQVGKYDYVNAWTFRDDGTIEPRLGLTGALQKTATGAAYAPFGSILNWPNDDPHFPVAEPIVGLGHFHNVYYRLDFDINGPGNDAVKELAMYSPAMPSPDSQCLQAAECWRKIETSIDTEQALDAVDWQNKSWLVYDTLTKNLERRPIGYEVVPHAAGLIRGMFDSAEPWAAHDVWVTRYKGCESLAVNNHVPHISSSCSTAADNVSAMLNGESTNNADVVLWYANRVAHLPRDEDEARMPIEWMSFEIRPRSFFYKNPAE